MSLTHYVVIRRDLTFGEYSAQLAHTGEAYHLLARRSELLFGYNETICVVKGARNEGKLRKLEGELIAAGIPHVAIRETDGRLKGQVTAVSLVPDYRAKVEEYVREFHTIEGLDEVKCRRCQRVIESADTDTGKLERRHFAMNGLCVPCFTSNA